MSYTSTNGMFTYTITNNTNYVIEQLDYDIILSSVNRWESLVTIDTRFPSSQTITISFTIDTLGTNILGGASITNSAYINSYIYGNVIPLTANITMNNIYLYGLKTTIRTDGFSSYYHVLLHEIGHILGIGSFWYLTGCPKTSYDDNGTTKHYYTGTNAVREYNSCFAGFSNDAFLGIPIEDDGGAGTSGVHPEEGGVSSNDRYINGILHPGLGTELMTGWLDGSPVSTPLSKISLGFLEDIGYTVNYNLADVYTMSWLATTDANNLEQTYIQGFLDVSGGNMINRNGNLSVLDGTMDVNGDVTFDSKLSVGGDVSFNGTTIDICGNLYAQYPNNSIPSAAIDGLGDVTPNFTGDVDFQAGVTIATKAAIGSTTLPTGSTTLKVTGDLDFTGSLLNNGTAFVSGATELDGLTDVKKGVAEFTNSMLIGFASPPATGTLANAHSNIGIGSQVFQSLTSGNSNVGIGVQSLFKNTTGDSNIAVGKSSLRMCETGNTNVAVGGSGLYENTTGSSNVAVGGSALSANDTGSENVGIGKFAGNSNTTGGGNISIGYLSGTINATGSNNTYIGKSSGADTGLTALSNSTAVGASAKVTASNQIMLGTASESVVIPGKLDVVSDISFSGDLYQNGSLFSGGATNLNGLSDVKAGGTDFANSLLIGTTTTGTLSAAEHNIGIGTDALKVLESGQYNVAIGSNSLQSNTSGGYNIAIGSKALADNANGGHNVATGYNALYVNTSGGHNVATGNHALSTNENGSYNVATGYNALKVNTSSYNVATGYDSGVINTTGQYNTYIGAKADADAGLTDLSNSTAIGASAKVTKSNQIMLGTAAEKVNIAGDITINPIDVSVDVSGIQQADEYVKFTIPYSMTALKYFCTAHSGMIGEFILADSTTEPDKTYYVRMAPDANTDGNIDDPYYIFSDTPNGTTLNGGALNNSASGGAGVKLTLYKGNTYTFISTNTVGHPFMVGDSWNVTTGIKLESTGDGAATASEYRDPYPLHVNGTANIERNLNVARTLTVSGPIRQW